MATLIRTTSRAGLLVAVVCALSPRPAFANDRGLLKVEFLYAVESAGGRSETLREPMDIFIDRKSGDLYVADAGRHEILVYNRSGMFVQSTPVGGKGGGPVLVAVDGDGRMIVGRASSAKLSLFDFWGHDLGPITLPGIVDVPENRIRPLSLTVSKDGAVYALKTSGGLVRVDPDDELYEETALAGEDAPNRIYGMAIDPHGRFLFTDMRPYSVVVFDPKAGTFERFGSAGVLRGQLARPVGVTTDDAGHIFVVSSRTNKVSCFEPDGTFVEDFGGPGDGYGSFYMPTAIATDGVDRVYVLENALKRVQVFRVQFVERDRAAKAAIEAKAAIAATRLRRAARANAEELDAPDMDSGTSEAPQSQPDGRLPTP